MSFLDALFRKQSTARALATSDDANDVNVDAAAPPTPGQVLSASDATHAEWVDPGDLSADDTVARAAAAAAQSTANTAVTNAATAQSTANAAGSAASAAQSTATAAGSAASAAQADVDGHEADTANPHAVTKTQVGLSNVTNDAQIALAAGSFSAFTHKAAPVSTDRIPLEDSANGNAKIYSPIAEVRSAAIFSTSAVINPMHYYKASNCTLASGSQGSGVASVVLDGGRAGATLRDLSQATSSKRCSQATDGNGKIYLAPDGVDDFYAAANTPSDWSFLHNGNAWAIGGVIHLLSDPGASKFLLDTNGGNIANTGLNVSIIWTSSTRYGIACGMGPSSGGIPVAGLDSSRVENVIIAFVMRYGGKQQPQRAQSVSLSMQLWMHGALWTYGTETTVAHNTGAPNNTLNLFAANNGASGFFPGRWYEKWINDNWVADASVQGYLGEMFLTYGAT